VRVEIANMGRISKNKGYGKENRILSAKPEKMGIAPEAMSGALTSGICQSPTGNP
jgi:hypothetical protein